MTDSRSSSVALLDCYPRDDPDHAIICEAGVWLVEFVNTLGGDFKLTHQTPGQFVINNASQCPCFKADPTMDAHTCEDLTTIITSVIKTLNKRLRFSCNYCSNDFNKGCEFELFLIPAD